MNPAADEADRREERFLYSYPAVSGKAPLVYVLYPNTYRVGMSNLGLHFLFHELSSRGDMRVKRVFTDFAEDASMPDLIFITISYEDDLINAIKILREMGVEPSREIRGRRPLIIAGGAAVSANPLPVSPIADAVALGEGEEAIKRIADAVAAAERPEESLPIIDREENVFVPSSGGPASASKKTEPLDFQHSSILAGDTVFSDTLLLEISRGCPGRCSFCLATALYEPFRAVPADRIEEIVEGPGKGAGKVGLVSTAAAAHPEFERIMDLLSSRSIDTGLSSLRADDLDEKKAKAIAGAGIRSVTLAPESGSERVRMTAGKGTRDEKFFSAASQLAGAGVRRIGLYLIAGLPGGGAEEFRDTEKFMSGMKKAARGARLVAHLNALVPKAGTPLQHYPLPPLSELESSMKNIESACRRAGVTCGVKSLRSSMRQAALSLGGEETGRALIRLSAGRVSWKKALLGEGVDPALPFRERGIEEPLPWERFYGDDERAVLVRRYRRIRKATT